MLKTSRNIIVMLVGVMLLCICIPKSTAMILSRDYNLYYANLHSHSKYSPIDFYSYVPLVWDSLVGHPRQAFAYARDSAGIDILAITDHTHYTTPILGGLYYLPQYWDSTRIAADDCTEAGNFAALAGFEWSSWYTGHINVLYSQDFRFTYSIDNTDSIYRWLATRSNVIAQFNHPELNDSNSFRYRVNIDSSIELFEMLNQAQANRYYIALDSGWYIGMTSSQDNHVYKTYGGVKWGGGNQLTGVWADSLTRSSVYSALRQMRTYGTLDRNFSLKFTANNSWMGSMIPNGNIQLSITARDPDTNDLISRIDIITNNGFILDSMININLNNAVWQKNIFTNVNENRYFYVRVIENDGDYIVSSAIWTRSNLEILEPLDSKIFSSMILTSNYPNPFTNQTTIFYSLPVDCNVNLAIYNYSGRQVRSSEFKRKQAGNYQVFWDGKDDKNLDLENGVYFYKLDAGNYSAVKKIVLSR